MIRRPFGQRRATYNATILKRLNCFVGRYTLRRPLSIRALGGHTGTDYWRVEHSRAPSLPRYHKLGTLRTGTRVSHASRQALRAWYRSTVVSTWSKNPAKPSYSARGTPGLLIHKPVWDILLDKWFGGW